MPDPTHPLTDRSVLVTGGASGLGAAVVRRVDAAGGSPVVLDLRAGDGTWPSYEADLADTAATEEAVAKALADLDAPLGGVVTCAGIDRPAPFTALPAEEWERIVRVNLFGTATVVRAALDRVEADGGRVVTVASTLGHGVAGDASAYCASKWGVVGLTRALTEELKGRVSFTLLTPGGMQTAFFDGRDEQYRPGPDARLCDPDDVADAVVFALTRPPGCDVKEMVVAGPTEVSWP
ncbi:MAG TPA: SDR family oxidoreductase [Iamia sp.]|nr:SDR family oxidoreductase [Iamia sp.]